MLTSAQSSLDIPGDWLRSASTEVSRRRATIAVEPSEKDQRSSDVNQRAQRIYDARRQGLLMRLADEMGVERAERLVEAWEAEAARRGSDPADPVFWMDTGSGRPARSGGRGARGTGSSRS